MPFDPPKDWSETEIVLQEYNPPKDWSETEIVLEKKQAQGQTSSAVTGSATSDAEVPSSTLVTDAVTKQEEAVADVSTSTSEIKSLAVTDKALAAGSIAEIISKEISQGVTEPVSAEASVAEVINKDVSEGVAAASKAEAGVASARTQGGEPERVTSGFTSREDRRVEKTVDIGVRVPKSVYTESEVDLFVPVLYPENALFDLESAKEVKDITSSQGFEVDKNVNAVGRVDVYSAKRFNKSEEVSAVCETSNERLIKVLELI